MKEWDGRAWMFGGDEKLWIFDLRTERWSQKKIEPASRQQRVWPYPDKKLAEPSFEISEGMMYVFGGDSGPSHLGTNIFLSIDLRTFKWTHLSGTSAAIMTTTEPPLRRFPTTWIVPSQRRFYVMYGHACRADALGHNAPHGNEEDFSYDDLWSWSLDEKKWRRERVQGNLPSPRTEIAGSFNSTIGKIIIYGGYCGSTTTVSYGQVLQFAYYGDTFMFDPETGRFKQILTRGFPSYRAQSKMLVDGSTGKTYLWGGASFLFRIVLRHFTYHIPRLDQHGFRSIQTSTHEGLPRCMAASHRYARRSLRRGEAAA